MSPRVAVAVVSLAAVPMGATSAGAEGPALRLVWFDPSELAPGSESVAREEAEALLGRMGASVAWRRGAAGELMRSDEVWIVLVGEGPKPASGSRVLGATLARQQLAPLVWVRVPNVRAALGISRTRPQLELRPDELRVLGVALGRVLTHEVVHAVVPALQHGSGLMSTSFTRAQLAAGSLPIESQVTLAFRAALREDRSLAAEGSRTLAARAGAGEE
jgi:hypothetical protein